MDELRRLQRGTSLILAGALLAAGALALGLGHGELLSGLVAGGLVGLVNLTWLLGTVRRLGRVGASARAHQVAGMVRFGAVAVALGVLLVTGHVHPIGAVIGYGLFPLAAAAAGGFILQPAHRPAA